MQEPFDLCRAVLAAAPRVTVLNIYGTTECAADVTFASFTKGTKMPDVALCPIGAAIPNVEIQILDPATLKRMPHGQLGEIFVAGAALARG